MKNSLMRLKVSQMSDLFKKHLVKVIVEIEFGILIYLRNVTAIFPFFFSVISLFLCLGYDTQLYLVGEAQVLEF